MLLVVIIPTITDVSTHSTPTEDTKTKVLIYIIVYSPSCCLSSPAPPSLTSPPRPPILAFHSITHSDIATHTPSDDIKIKVLICKVALALLCLSSSSAPTVNHFPCSLHRPLPPAEDTIAKDLQDRSADDILIVEPSRPVLTDIIMTFTKTFTLPGVVCQWHIYIYISFFLFPQLMFCFLQGSS